tara:strand:+ start:275 stop:1057 length:783 start_codon:yes stop_codon:yes gene_type:complete
MDILSELFKNEDEDNKYVIFTAFALSLANADGKTSNEEIEYIRKYLSSLPGMTEKRLRNIEEKAFNQSEEAFKIALNFNNEEKIELMNLLTNVAISDGYFHGEEASYILKFAIDLGFNHNESIDYIFDNFDVNIDEFIRASKKRLNLSDRDVFNFRDELIQKKLNKSDQEIIKITSNLGDESMLRVNINDLEEREVVLESGYKKMTAFYQNKPFIGIGFEFFEVNNQKYYIEWIYKEVFGQMVHPQEQFEYERLKGLASK